MDQTEKKRQAAIAALDYIDDGITLGVGSGTTVHQFVDAFAPVKDKIAAVVASSWDTQSRLEAQGFEVSDLADTGDIDLYVDGADEANKHFQLSILDHHHRHGGA